jgi:hypothetical protein
VPTCEHCSNEHDGSYATGRFCAEFCYRQFVTAKGNAKLSQKWDSIHASYDSNPNRCKECDEALSFRRRNKPFCSKKCSSKHSNKGKFWAKPKQCRRCSNPATKGSVLCERCRDSHLKRTSPDKKFIVAKKGGKPPRNALLMIREYRCEGEGCGLTGMWLGKPLTLHFDHINGDRRDHRLGNIRWLCPNCHSQTETYAGRNIASARLKRFSGVQAQTHDFESTASEGSTPST